MRQWRPYGRCRGRMRRGGAGDKSRRRESGSSRRKCTAVPSWEKTSVSRCVFFQAEDGIRDIGVTGVQTCALPISVRSGQAVARAAAESLKRVHLELGGKAPVVIFPDADLAAAASALRAAGYWNSGQECGAACRVLVHESVADEFAQLLVDEVATMVVGEPAAGDDVEIGPLISKAHFERVTGYLRRAEAEGLRAAIGGGAIEGDGYFVAPTVLVDVPDGAEAAREEIFGPVITIETFTEEDEAVTRANAVPYGLSASVWTDDARRSHDVAAKLDAGTVWVNAHLVLANEAPWGGFKGSGYGRDLSVYARSEEERRVGKECRSRRSPYH